MKTLFRQINSFFLLLVFLFPLAEKGIHDFTHRNDFHCAERSAKHFHNPEHNCSLCDYQAPVSHEQSFTTATFLVTGEYRETAVIPVAETTVPFFFSLASRGPPSFC